MDIHHLTVASARRKNTHQAAQDNCARKELEATLCAVQGKASGRLLSYNPATRKTHVVTDGLWFANGVTLSKDESFVAVVETNVQRVHRVWVSGPKVHS